MTSDVPTSTTVATAIGNAPKLLRCPNGDDGMLSYPDRKCKTCGFVWSMAELLKAIPND